MTLFEFDRFAVDDLTARRAPNLPSPTKRRYMPLRAGVLNVWEFDDQQFWFADGRLLLRGRNEAGKSKVLELLFPFVLDGDISPKKLDPFDTANKSMWWNMIGFHPDRSVAIGYLWLEFGRLDETGAADYLTVIVGVQATRAERKVNTWFAVTPQRVDVDLDLAPGEVCRTQESFTKALSTEARFATKASAHRAHVAVRLFAMSPERFDNLLHLLRQLRKPKLADKLDSKKLSTVLTNALPPLDESRIEPLATGFGFLDADIEDLRRTEAAFRATGTFLDTYRHYARTQVRRRADDVRAAVTGFDDVTREERDNVRALETARQETARLNDDAVDLAREYATASGSLSGLDLSAVESLRSLEQLAKADAKVVDGVAGEAERARGNARLAGAEADTRTHAAEKDLAALIDLLEKARRAGDRAVVPVGWEDAADHRRGAEQLTVAVRTRRSLVEAVADADRRASKAREQLSAAEQRVSAATARRDEAADALAAATLAATGARARFAEGVDSWCMAAPARNPDVDGETIADELAEALPGGDRAARKVAGRLAGPAVDAAEVALHGAIVAVADATVGQRRARADLAAHDDLPADPPPPLRAGIPAVRTGVPFWLAVEFTDGIDGADAAMLEAALDAAGLLDAVVTETGLLALDSDDTLVGADEIAGPGIRDWLRPAEGSDVAVVERILASIGAGPDAGRDCWADLDGTWGNGPLTGRWSKPTVEHIGAAARADAHARRRDQLVAIAEAADGALEAEETTLEVVRAAKGKVHDWLEDFPSVADWAGAERTLGTATAASDKADSDHRREVAAHDQVSRQVAHALGAVELAAGAAQCLPDGVPAARTALDNAADIARDLGGAARDHARSALEARNAVERTERLEGEAADVEGRLERTRLAAFESKSKYDTAVALEGADVEQVLAEKDRLERVVNQLRDRRHRVDDDRAAARETEIRAEGVLTETGRRRVRATTGRDGALSALAAVVRTGHVALAVALDASREPAEYLQATAGRTLARQIATAVPDEEASDEARSRATDRLVREFNALHDAVGTDFDPHLDTANELFVASATLNGEVIGVAELHQALGDDVEQRRRAIAAEERALIEQHLRDEVGNHLGNCLHAATTQVQQMNAILREHPTNSGASVQLQWRVIDDAGPAVRDAVGAMLSAPTTRDEATSITLAGFLAERVALARRGEVDGADLTERLISALDYRGWYSFKVHYKTRAGEGELTASTVGTGSGGQQAKVAHLPLLAAAAGFYSSSPSAPRLCFLDEAFAGIDGPNTSDLLAMSVTLDLDMVMTNFDAWFCTPQVPGLAIYHLEKLPGTVGVAAIRYEWDGDQQQEVDLWLES